MKWGTINDYLTSINHSKIDLTALPNKYLTNTGYTITSQALIPYSDLNIAANDISGSKLTDNTIGYQKLYTNTPVNNYVLSYVAASTPALQWVAQIGGVPDANIVVQ